jgi:1,4-dihydroxy-2-naphthoyl-CoA hydrolase
VNGEPSSEPSSEPSDAAQTMNAMNQENMIGLLGITMLEASLDRVVATMPVGPRVHQPFGLLHGGASVALAETVASLGAYVNVMGSGMGAVGLEINANHLRAVRDGVITATATPLHKGRTTHVWHVEIRDEAGRMVCVSRCTLAIIPAAP